MFCTLVYKINSASTVTSLCNSSMSPAEGVLNKFYTETGGSKEYLDPSTSVFIKDTFFVVVALIIAE